MVEENILLILIKYSNAEPELMPIWISQRLVWIDTDFNRTVEIPIVFETIKPYYPGVYSSLEGYILSKDRVYPGV